MKARGRGRPTKLPADHVATTLRLPTALNDQLRFLALARNQSVNDVISQLVEAWYGGNLLPTPPTRTEKALFTQLAMKRAEQAD